MAKWLCSVLLLMFAAPALADKQEVIRFSDNLAAQALAIVKQKELGAAEQQRQLEELFDSHVDIDWVARFVLGKYWRGATPQQRDAYLRNYKNFVLKYYTSRLTDYTGQDYNITAAREDRANPGEYWLSMELLNVNEPSLLVDYRIRHDNGGYKIFDIVIEGVSMITTQRSEFHSVIANKGLDYLIEALAKKAAAAGA